MNPKNPIRAVFSRQLSIRNSEERVLTRILGKFDLRLFFRNNKTAGSDVFENVLILHVRFNSLLYL